MALETNYQSNHKARLLYAWEQSAFGLWPRDCEEIWGGHRLPITACWSSSAERQQALWDIYSMACCSGFEIGRRGSLQYQDSTKLSDNEYIKELEDGRSSYN